MTIDLAHIALMIAAGVASVVVSIIGWAVKGLIADFKETMREVLKRLGEHETKIAVLDVKVNNGESYRASGGRR